MVQNVLILEDNLLMATILNMQLEELGYKNIFLSSDIEEAEENLDNKEIDLIITDYYLAGRDAADFIETGQARNIPILIVSGRKDDLPSYAPNRLDLLSKPYEFVDLADKINRLLDQDNKHDQAS